MGKVPDQEQSTKVWAWVRVQLLGPIFQACVSKEILCDDGSVYLWLLDTWNVASASVELNFKFYVILMNYIQI